MEGMEGCGDREPGGVAEPAELDGEDGTEGDLGNAIPLLPLLVLSVPPSKPPTGSILQLLLTRAGLPTA